MSYGINKNKMGIKHLNRFFKENASSSIQFISLSELSGKKLAIDISIYMYKYASENNLIENIYLMLSVFRHYNIIPIFIFDGKPPAEKKALLRKRRENKKSAENEYNILKNLIINNYNLDDHEKQEIKNNMDMLKRNFIYIGKNDIETIKNLIKAYGATYYDAPGEADKLCAELTIKEKVWATLSEDMDMFVYGCPRVVRYLSLLNHTAVLYDLNGILKNLGITQKELREICILSGTDYNTNDESINTNYETKNTSMLYTTLKYFKKFIKERKNQSNFTLDFYNWLVEKTNFVKDYNLLQKINSMFDLNDNIQIFENIQITNGPINKDDLHNILKLDGFIFPIHF
jgi:flap endonuclease-1